MTDIKDTVFENTIQELIAEGGFAAICEELNIPDIECP